VAASPHHDPPPTLVHASELIRYAGVRFDRRLSMGQPNKSGEFRATLIIARQKVISRRQSGAG
jgi:hypothetical protein